MATSPPLEPFRGLLLRHRGRTGLTQSQLAHRMSVAPRTIQDWETGLNYPTAPRLQALIAAILEAGGLTAGQEADEAKALWTAVERQTVRSHPPFDSEWFLRLVADRVTPTGIPDGSAAAEPPARRASSG